MQAPLTAKHAAELKRAVLDYLYANGFPRAAAVLAEEAGLDPAPPAAGYAGLLERKWTSVVRMQRKILDLETQVAQLLEEAATRPARATAGHVLPRAPPRHTLEGHRQPVTGVCFHPSYPIVCTSAEDATCKVWDYETGQYECTLKGHTKTVASCAYDAKGTLLATASSDLTIKLWDVAAGYANTRTLHGHDHVVSCVVFCGDMLVSASRDHTIRVWDPASGFCVRTLRHHTDWVRALAVAPEADFLVSTSSDQTAMVWSTATWEPTATLRDHTHVVECAAIAPTTTGEHVAELLGVPATEARYVATGARDKLVRLWDAATGVCVHTFEGHDNWVRGVVFAPSGRYLLSVADDKTIRCWDLQSGRCVKVIEAHNPFVTCVAWSPLLSVIATGGVDNTVKIWDCA